MKKLFTLFAITLAVMVSSCSKFDDTAIWDKLNEQEETLNDHEKRIAVLEELCRQLNTNIDALQTIVEALEKKDYVTNVSPVREDGEVVGYTISFANSDTITIYNGEDGKDGQNGKDGKDGYTPQIGVMKDTDGIYYWTLDGEWLLDGKGNKIKAVGEDGQDGTNGSNGEDGRDGQDGTDGTNGSNGSNGQDGQDGVDGKDGITPRLKIENDYWYVSYDEGATWIELGRATGEDGADGSDGVDGSDGKDGDSIFSSVTQDDEYVYFNLADGTMITLPKHDKENIQFEDLQVKAICCKNWDTNNDGELSYAEAAAVTDIGTVFKGNTNIIAFTELKYFAGLTLLQSSSFEGCTQLWKIVIPVGVRSIGEKAFYGDTNLTQVDLSLCTDLNIIGNSAFKKTSIREMFIPNDVRQINKEAFYGCSQLESLSFEGDSMLTQIGVSAFEGTILKDLFIPASVTIIEVAAFYGCPITAVHFEEASSLETIKGAYRSGYSYYNIERGAFANCTLLETITIPASVTTIEASAFYGCSKLQNVHFEDNSNLVELTGFLYQTGHNTDNPCRGCGVFGNCSSLKSIIIPKGVTELMPGTFSGCTSLESVEFEYGSLLSKINGDKCTHSGTYVTQVSTGVFNNCSALSLIVLGTSTPPYCHSISFTGLTKSKITVRVPAGSLDSYQNDSSWKSFKLEEYYE